MSTEAESPAEKTKGPGTNTGMAKLMDENFAKISENIKTLAQAVQSIRSDVNELKRKKPPQCPEDNDISGNNKKSRSQAEQPSTSGFAQHNVNGRTSPLSTSADREGAHVLSDDESDIDDLLDEESEENTVDEEEDDLLNDLEDFFKGQETTGPEVPERIAKITQRALRGEIDKEAEKKLKELRKKHKRPSNIDNMQIPTIEPFMWRQLRRGTRSTDFVQIKALESYNYILTPLIKALDLFKSQKDQKKAVEYVADAYKLIGLTVKTTNIARMEKVKKELHPDYKSLCDPKKTTATSLMGENMSEEIKKVKESSKNSPFESPFLGRKGGSKQPQKRFFKGASRNTTQNNNNFNNNRNNGHNYNNQKKPQNKGYNKQKQHFQNKK